MRFELENMENAVVPGTTLGFSFIRPENLGASEYTLVTIVVDKTGSVDAFSKELLLSLKEAIKSCKKSPRVNNLLLRVISFNTSIEEIHGFTEISQLDIDAYENFKCCGMTALYDASLSAIGATNTYAKDLISKDFDVNGIIFIITDGDDNASKHNVSDVKNAINDSRKAEVIESLQSILIGINDKDCAVELENFKNNAEIDQYINVGDVTPGKLAKLAKFVSQSISSQSKALGSGKQSTPLTF